MQKVAVVGAGIAGLAAARSLRQAGLDVVLYESTEKVGGRVETISDSGYTFDSGATSIAPRGRALEKVMFDELSTSDLIKVERPIFIHSAMRISAGDSAKNAIPRYCYRSGVATLPQMLSEGLDIRLNHPIHELRMRDKTVYEIGSEEYDFLILATPIPESQKLLNELGRNRPLQHSTYRSCLSVCLGFRHQAPAVQYHAILEPEQRHPLTWLSIESLKSPDRAPEGCTAFVAQLSAPYSKDHLESEDKLIVDTTLEYVKRLYGKDWEAPEVAIVRRWRYSQPEMTAMFEAVNHPGNTLFVVGDGVMGGRVEFAFESGFQAAKLILQQLDMLKK